MATESPLPHFPASRPGMVRRGSVMSRSLSPEVSATIKRVSRERRVTGFMLLLTLFQMCLRRYTGADRVLIGTMVANRPYTEVESLIGVFATSLALLVERPADESLGTNIASTRDVLLDALRDQILPMWQLAEATGQPIDSSLLRPRLSFTLQTAPPRDPSIPGLDISEFASRGAEIFEQEEGTAIAAFDQAWEVWEAADRYVLVVIYRQCFARSDVGDMLGTFLGEIDAVCGGGRV